MRDYFQMLIFIAYIYEYIIIMCQLSKVNGIAVNLYSLDGCSCSDLSALDLFYNSLIQFDSEFTEALVEKYNEMAARFPTTQVATFTETVLAADVADRTSTTGSVSVGVGNGIQNANNLGSAGDEPSGASGGAPSVSLIDASTAYTSGRMKPLTAEQAMQVKRALTGRQLHFDDRMRGNKESANKGLLLLIKYILLLV